MFSYFLPNKNILLSLNSHKYTLYNWIKNNLTSIWVLASAYKLFMLFYRVKWLIMIEGILFFLSVLVEKQRWTAEVIFKQFIKN